MKSKLAFLSVAGLVSASVLSCSRERPVADVTQSADAAPTLTAAQRDRLHIEPVQRSSFHRIIETTGTVGFDNDQATTVLAPISGPVTRLLVSLGAHVNAGDPLAEVASPDYATAISGYRKAVVSEENLQRIAKLDQELFNADALARRDLEQAQTDAANATADREAALQQLHAIGVPDETIREIQEGHAATRVSGVIRSPLSGTVVEKLITPGQLLQAGTTPCFTVADLSKVWVMADVFESQLPEVSIGDRAAIVTSASERPIVGTVENISAILDPNTRAVAVRVVADNPGEVLKKQMYVQVRIQSHQDTVGILVPTSAVLRDEEDLPFVYVARSDGTFARQRVTLGTTANGSYEIKAGLKEGEQIVTEGGLYVQFQQNQ